MSADIPSIGDWTTNGELIEDVHQLGWILDEHLVLDVTYGHGGFWTHYRPRFLVKGDLHPSRVDVYCADFRWLWFPDASYDVVVFDPPYKLNGTPTHPLDDKYGAGETARWQDRIQLIVDGLEEVARVARKHIIVKCQDQVVSGAMRWQTDVVRDVLEPLGWRKADRFDFGAGRGRPQPSGRTQKHARHDASQLLVFTRGNPNNGF